MPGRQAAVCSRVGLRAPAARANLKPVSDASKLEQLSNGQKECLRLVFRGYETKDIAPRVGLSIDGVNARLKAAMRTLGVSRRSEAARLLAEHEGDYQRQVHPPLVVPESPESSPDGRASNTGEQDAQHGHGLTIGEEPVPYEAPALRRRWHLRLPFPTKGRDRNDLTLLEGVIWIVVGTALLAVATGAVLNAFATLTALSR